LLSFVRELLEKLAKSIASVIRKFVAYSLLMFFFGALFGAYVISGHVPHGIEPAAILLIPFLLALLAYVSTEIAVILFILLLGLVLLVFV